MNDFFEAILKGFTLIRGDKQNGLLSNNFMYSFNRISDAELAGIAYEKAYTKGLLKASEG